MQIYARLLKIQAASLRGNKFKIRKELLKIANVTGITLSSTNLRLHIGDTFQLNATVLPINATNKNVTWITSNSNVAMVTTNGLVDAGRAGTATITVRSVADTSKIATCAVTVVAGTSDVPNPINADGFGGWYNSPSSKTTGTNNRVPRFVHINPGPCLAYSIMMGCHYLYHSSVNPTTFFNNRFTNGYIDSGGFAQWEGFVDIHNHNLATIRSQLHSGKPVVVSGNNNNYDHFALIVAFRNNGTANSDFIVIDPLRTPQTGYPQFPTTFAAFKSSFQNDTVQFKGQKGYNNTFPMFIFK